MTIYNGTLTAANGTGQIAVSISINEMPAAPEQTSAIPALTATKGTLFSYDFSQHFSGEEIGYALSGGVPSWLTIDPVTGIGSGTPV